jgi:hypothetical protein
MRKQANFGLLLMGVGFVCLTYYNIDYLFLRPKLTYAQFFRQQFWIAAVAVVTIWVGVLLIEKAS